MKKCNGSRRRLKIFSRSCFLYQNKGFDGVGA